MPVKDEKKIVEALIIAMKNELRVIELYSNCAKRDLNEDSKKNVKVLIKDEENHMRLLKEAFEKILNRKLDTSKLKDASLKTVKVIKDDPSYLHIVDIAIGYEKTEKAHFEKSEAALDIKELKDLFKFLIIEEQKHLDILEKERKVAGGHPFEEFELDFYVRE